MIPVTLGLDKLVNFPNNVVLHSNTWDQFLTDSYYLLKTFIEIGEIALFTAMQKIDQIINYAENADLDEFDSGEEFMLSFGKIANEIGIIYSQLQAKELTVRKSHLAPQCFGAFEGVARKNFQEYVSVARSRKLTNNVMQFVEFINECSYYPLQDRMKLLKTNYTSSKAQKKLKRTFTEQEIKGMKILYEAYESALNDDTVYDSWFNKFRQLRTRLLALNFDYVEIEYFKDIPNLSAYSTVALNKFKLKGHKTFVNFKTTIAEMVNFELFIVE